MSGVVKLFTGDTPALPATPAFDEKAAREEEEKEEEEREQRRSLRQRRRYGLRQLIATSYRGILSPEEEYPRRRSLLGE